MLFRDVHEYLRDGFIAELANAGTVNGTEVTGTTLLVSGPYCNCRWQRSYWPGFCRNGSADSPTLSSLR